MDIGEIRHLPLMHLISLRSISSEWDSKELSPLAHEWTSIKPPSSHQKFRLSLNLRQHQKTNIFLTFFLLVIPPKFAQYHVYKKGLLGGVSFVYNLKDFTSNSIHMTKEECMLHAVPFCRNATERS